MAETFREIDEELLSLLTEDGEIIDTERFEALQIARGKKIEGLANYILDLRDRVEALKREKARIADMQRRTEEKIEDLREFLVGVCGGERFTSDTIQIGMRHSTSVEIEDPDKLMAWAKEGHEDILKYPDPTVAKSVVATYLEMGIDVPGAVQRDRVTPVIR